MAFAQWSDSYSVYNAQMDTQHRRLVELLNRLHEAMAAGKVADVVEPILKELLQYTVTHFQAEEQLMLRLGFAGYREHKALHDKLTADVKQAAADVISKKTTVSLQLLMFLRNWLFQHIAGSDKEYGELCRTKRVA